MHRWKILFLWGGLAASLNAAPAVVVNTLDVRPVFTVKHATGVETRSLAPGQRLSLEEGLFSGLGEKDVPLQAGQTYFVARLGALPRLYWLTADQCLIVNQSGRAVDLGWGPAPRRLLAVGTLALASTAKGPLVARWTDGNEEKTQALEGGHVYRLVLDSPQGLGTAVVLKAWDEVTE